MKSGTKRLEVSQDIFTRLMKVADEARKRVSQMSPEEKAKLEEEARKFIAMSRDENLMVRRELEKASTRVSKMAPEQRAEAKAKLLGEKTAKWLATSKGRKSLARTLKHADKLSEALDKMTRVPRKKLHEPVTI